MNPALFLDPRRVRRTGTYTPSLTLLSSYPQSSTSSLLFFHTLQPISSFGSTQPRGARALLIHYKMEASVLDVERADNQSSDTSSMSSIVVYEAPKAQLGGPVVENADSLPEDSVTNSQQELTEHVTGDAATHDNNNKSPAFQTPPTSQTFFPPQANGSPTAHTPRFDPRALLNPKSAAAKRPASSGQDSERGRTEPTVTGQVSLVERLHNVQERTASPAKRVKTEDPPKQNGNRAN
jgi:hypothetical protein